MFTIDLPLEQEDEFLAQVSHLAYDVVLRNGLRRPFIEVELGLWRRIGSAYHAQDVRHAILEDDFLAHVTDIACQAVAQQGLRRPIPDWEADLGLEIRAAYESLAARELTEVA